MNALSRHAPLGAALLAAPAIALAQAPAPAEPLWELGAFALGVSQQAYPGADQTVQRALALPYVIYRGPLLRIDRGSAGIRAVKTSRFELDVGFAGSFGSRADEVDARRGMADIGTLVEFGPRLRWNLGETPGGGRWRADLPLRGVFDLEDRLALRGVALEPELAWEQRSAGWRWGASVGAVLGNRRLADTFYRVAPSEARPGRPAYDAEAGLISLRLGASASRQLTPDWRLFASGRIDSVGEGANRDSPLVRRTTGSSVIVGVVYTWLRSERPAAP